MRPLTIADAPMVVLALQDEIRRTDESRYDHRLHAVLLVAQGMTCRQAATVLGDAPRTVEYWVRDFERAGLAGLQEGSRPGRPRRLTEEHLKIIGQVLRKPPEEVGLTANLWDGKALCCYLRREFGVDLGVRQCQRLFRSLGFRLRKPRPQIAHGDAELQSAHKKTPSPDGRPHGGSLGLGRGSLPTARLPLPHVDSARGARSGFAAPSYAEASGLFRSRPAVRWAIPLPKGAGPLQRQNLLGLLEVPPAGMQEQQEEGDRDLGQRQVPSRPAAQILAREDGATLRARLPASL